MGVERLLWPELHFQVWFPDELLYCSNFWGIGLSEAWIHARNPWVRMARGLRCGRQSLTSFAAPGSWHVAGSACTCAEHDPEPGQGGDASWLEDALPFLSSLFRVLKCI